MSRRRMEVDVAVKEDHECKHRYRGGARRRTPLPRRSTEADTVVEEEDGGRRRMPPSRRSTEEMPREEKEESSMKRMDLTRWTHGTT